MAGNDTKMLNFVRSIYLLIDKDGQLGDLACSVLIRAARDKLLELYLCQLPALFTHRPSFLQLILATFDKFNRCMAD